MRWLLAFLLQLLVRIGWGVVPAALRDARRDAVHRDEQDDARRDRDDRRVVLEELHEFIHPVSFPV